MWSHALKCSVKSYAIGPSINCYFNEVVFMRILTHDKIKQTNGCECFGVPWSPGFVLGLPPRGGFWKWSKWPWSMIHMIRSMSCRNPNRLYIQLAFTYSVGPSRMVWSELQPALPFSTNESAWGVMVMGSQSRVWSGPKGIDQLFPNSPPLIATMVKANCLQSALVSTLPQNDLTSHCGKSITWIIDCIDHCYIRCM